MISGYVSSGGTDCTYNYTLYDSNTKVAYKESSPIKFGSNTGILIITSYVEFTL